MTTKFKITTDDEQIFQVTAEDDDALTAAWRKWQTAPERMDAHEWSNVLEAATFAIEEELSGDVAVTEVQIED